MTITDHENDVIDSKKWAILTKSDILDPKFKLEIRI